MKCRWHDHAAKKPLGEGAAEAINTKNAGGPSERSAGK
jgi:hypothetical protein